MAGWRRAVAVLLVVTVAAFGVAVGRHAAHHPSLALGETAGWAITLQVAAAVGATAAGFALLRLPAARTSGALLILAGPAIVLALVPGSEAGSSVAFTAALAGATSAPVLVGAAAALYPSWPAPRLLLWLVAGALLVGVGVEGLLRAALFNPSASGCFTCPNNLLEVHADPMAYALLERWAPRLALGWGAVLVLAVAWRWLRADPAVRRLTIGLVAASLVPLLSCVIAIQEVTASAEPLDRAARQGWLLQCAVVVVVVALLAREGMAVRRMRRLTAGNALKANADAKDLRTALAAAIGTDDVDLVFPRERSEAVLLDGALAPARTPTQAAVVVRRDGLVTAEVRYPLAFSGIAYRIIAATRAAALALEHLGATARLRAELAQLQASRLRVVETGDAERRRLERNLHDGAQQRLIALSILLRTGTATSVGSRYAYNEAADRVASALGQMRTIARGIHPAMLTDVDLGAGLASLADASSVPVTVSTPPGTRPPLGVATTVFRLVADSVSEAELSSLEAVAATVELVGQDLRVRVQLYAPAEFAASAAVVVSRTKDRAATLGGTLTNTTGPGLQEIEMVIPCGS